MSSAPLHWLAIGLLVIPLAGRAGLEAQECDDLSGRPIIFGVNWQTDVKPIINEILSPTGRCTSCHNAGSPAGGLDLSDTLFDAIYKIVNSYVIPGEPAQSLLFLKINCDQPPVGERMPIGGTLSIEEQELFFDWIAQGATGEPPEEPIFRDFIYRDSLESLRR